jgi:hypothetical protein
MVTKNTALTAKLESYSDANFYRHELPLYQNLLLRLEYSKFTGRPCLARNEMFDRLCAINLESRLARCMEKPKPVAIIILNDYILAIKYDKLCDSQYTESMKLEIASIIKDYLLTYDELQAYKNYSLGFEKRL